MTVTVAALTHGRDVPSARFRVRQYLDRLEDLDVEVREYPAPIPAPAPNPLRPTVERFPPLLSATSAAWGAVKVASRSPSILASRRAQVTWLTREVLPGYFTLERMLKRPVVLDVDDAIWLRPPHGEVAARRAAEMAAVVVAGNRYLAEWFSRYAGRVEVIPTTIDTARYTPAPTNGHPNDGRFVVGWTGTWANFRYLYEIEEALAAFLRGRAAELLVVADAEPRFTYLTEDDVRFVRWSPDREVEAVRQMDVGIMPLTATSWSRGKCGFKILQYLACGVPVVASPVGANVDIVAGNQVGFLADDHDDWVDALATLHESSSRRQRMGARGRRLTVEHYSTEAMAPRLAEVFRSVA